MTGSSKETDTVNDSSKKTCTIKKQTIGRCLLRSVRDSLHTDRWMLHLLIVKWSLIQIGNDAIGEMILDSSHHLNINLELTFLNVYACRVFFIENTYHICGIPIPKFFEFLRKMLPQHCLLSLFENWKISPHELLPRVSYLHKHRPCLARDLAWRADDPVSSSVRSPSSFSPPASSSPLRWRPPPVPPQSWPAALVASPPTSARALVGVAHCQRKVCARIPHAVLPPAEAVGITWEPPLYPLIGHLWVGQSLVRNDEYKFKTSIVQPSLRKWDALKDLQGKHVSVHIRRNMNDWRLDVTIHVQLRSGNLASVQERGWSSFGRGPSD